MTPKTMQIRNSTAEFLIFTKQTGENGIGVRVQDGTIWLSQKLMVTLSTMTTSGWRTYLSCTKSWQANFLWKAKRATRGGSGSEGALY